MTRQILGLACCLLLGACDLIPRGAGLQSEVLATQDAVGNDLPTTFAVEPVTRDNLATFLHWPDLGDAHLPWINRVDQPNNRIISAGDTLTVTIWDTEERGLLTAPGQRQATLPDLTVSSAGTVFLPYIGKQRVSGMSPERARDVIEEKYLTVAPSAQVQVALTEGRARAVSLLGGVSAAGSYTLPDTDYTVLELIAEGGGVDTALVNPQVRLHRGERVYGTAYERLLDQPRLNTTLNGGDRVFLEEDERTFLSLGAAGSEAVHAFNDQSVTALEALAIIGGVAEDRADARGILILRRYPARTVTADRSGPDHPRTVFTIDLTTADGLFSAGQFLIQPDDLVYVTESPVTAAGSILAILGSVLAVGSQL